MDMNCVFCSWKSIEAKQLSEKKFSDGWHDGSGLRCSSCNRFSCYECLSMISRHISDTTPDKYQDNWCQAVNSYIQSGAQPSIFVGTCCENKAKKKNDYATNKLGDGDLNGALFLEDFNLFVDSPFTAIDVHGLGKVGNGRGTRHCVIDPVHANILKNEKIFPTDFPMNKFNLTDVDIKLPWSSKRKKVAILDERPGNISKMLTGENKVPGTIVQSSLFYKGQRCHENIDITIILGRFNDQPNDMQLLLMRLHSKEFSTEVPPSAASSLYKDIIKILSKSHGGFVCHRFGGSSGIWDKADSDFLKFLHHPGNFPRKAKGIKIIPMDTKLRCLYINTMDLRVCQVDYSVPRRGGKFKMPTELLLKKQYKFLFGFIESKIIAALLLQSMNRSQKFNYSINSPATNNEIKNIMHTQAQIKSLDERDLCDMVNIGRIIPFKVVRGRRGTYSIAPNKVNLSTRELFLIIHSFNHCTYTLVQHCVGMHEDFFNGSGTKSSLENKRCFVNRDIQGNIGRGGMGSQFVYGLLDW